MKILSKVIIGIDPGLATLGFGVITAEGNKLKPLSYGAIVTPSNMATADRLVVLYREIKQVLAKLKPELLAVEKLFFAKNVTTAMVVSEARGVVLLAAAQAKIKVVEVTPLQVKQAVAGYGKADKGQIQKMVKLILGLKETPKPDDVADALAIAVTASNQMFQL